MAWRDKIDPDPRAWVGCLACYSDGNLTGDWLDLDALEEFVDDTDSDRRLKVGCESADHGEFWVMEHENFHGAIDGECSPEDARDVALWLRDLEGVVGYDHLDAFVAYADNVTGSSITDCDPETASEAFRGVWDSAEDMARELHEETSDLGPLADYIDWNAVARDMLHDFYKYDLPDGTYAYFWAY